MTKRAWTTGELATKALLDNVLYTDANGESATGLTALSIAAAANNLIFVNTETLTANRTLTIKMNDASRTIDLGGNLTLGGDLTSAGGALTLTVGATTNATFPSGNVTLCDLGTAQSITGIKTFSTAPVISTITNTGTLTLPTSTDTLVGRATTDTLTNKTLTAPTINGGTATALTGLAIRSTGTGAYDLTFANSENLTVGRTLTLTVNDAARTISLAGNLTIAGAFTTAGAFTLTLTVTGNTGVTLPTSGTLTTSGANTFTGAQTLDGAVDTVLNPTTSPIIDIGADIFATGTFIDIAYDTAQTLTGALIGININLNTNVTLGNQNINGIIVAMPATYGTGAEVGIQVTGDGQTINISNDADIYISLAKASSVDINIQGISPVIDIGADVLASGTIIDFAYDTAQVLTASLIGTSMNMATNLTYVTAYNVTAYTTQTAAFTLAAAGTTTITGYGISAAGALVSNNAAAVLNWYGLDIAMPNVTQTLGAMTAYGIRITEGTTTSGTIAGILLNGTAVDTVINLSASPIIDIGPDSLTSGTFVDVTFDTATTMAGDFYGVNLDFSTNLTAATDRDIFVYRTLLPALTQSAANTTRFYGFTLPTAGALVQDTLAGTLDWRGLNIQLPNTTATTGTVTAYGLYVTEGTTTSGTVGGAYLNVTLALNMPKASDFRIVANTASALDISDGTTNLMTFDTRNTVTAVNAVTFNSSPPTIASAAGITYSQVSVAAKTVTLTGTTGVTAMNGLQLNLGAPTITDADACTVVTASTLYVAAPVAAGSAGITNIWAANIAGAVRIDGNISLANAAYDIVVIANTAACLEISDGTNKLLAFDDRTTTDNIIATTFTAAAPTIVSATGTTWRHISAAAVTVTLTGGTGVTAMNGVQLDIQAPTITSASATTVGIASTLMLRPITAGGSVTITNSYMINTSVAGCYLTAAGVWTSTSAREVKEGIEALDLADVPALLASVEVKQYRYRDNSDGGYIRYGLIAEDAPDFLASPDRKGLAALHMAGFSLAGLKYLMQEVDQLRAEVATLKKEKADATDDVTRNSRSKKR